ncbi:MAG: hypothetical protein EP343_15510 [Deltaproteobacteria bacterium]|nr:MAG: hypothetical protein EP343_15510 [Deltaproteobacteria bacterium]
MKLFEVFLPQSPSSPQTRVEVRAHDSFDALRRAIELSQSSLNMSSMDCDFGNDGSMTATDSVSGQTIEVRLYIPPPEPPPEDSLSQTMDIAAFPELDELKQMLREAERESADSFVHASSIPVSVPKPASPPPPAPKPSPSVNPSMFVAPPPPPPPPPSLPSGVTVPTQETKPGLPPSTIPDSDNLPPIPPPPLNAPQGKGGKLPDVNATMLLAQFGEEPDVLGGASSRPKLAGGRPSFGGEGVPQPSTPPPPSKPTKK